MGISDCIFQIPDWGGGRDFVVLFLWLFGFLGVWIGAGRTLDSWGFDGLNGFGV